MHLCSLSKAISSYKYLFFLWLNFNKELSFDVEDHLIDRIIYGLDDVDITLKSKDKIFNFEKYRKETRPWIFINE